VARTLGFFLKNYLFFIATSVKKFKKTMVAKRVEPTGPTRLARHLVAGRAEVFSPVS
jgi:hypothetical protein